MTDAAPAKRPEFAVIGFSGLTIHPTAHRFNVCDRDLHTWCAWDTLFLPALLDATASVRSTCPVTRNPVELVVTPDGVVSSTPKDLRVSFPPLAETDATDITTTFCCHVHFLAGADAAADWKSANPGGYSLDLNRAFELGQSAVAPLLASPERVEVGY